MGLHGALGRLGCLPVSPRELLVCPPVPGHKNKPLCHFRGCICHCFVGVLRIKFRSLCLMGKHGAEPSPPSVNALLTEQYGWLLTPESSAGETSCTSLLDFLTRPLKTHSGKKLTETSWLSQPRYFIVRQTFIYRTDTEMSPLPNPTTGVCLPLL